MLRWRLRTCSRSQRNEAAEAPGVEGDELGDDLLDVAVGLEVVEDADAVGEPVGLALDPREDGRDGVDAVGGGIVAGDGLPSADLGPPDLLLMVGW